MEAVAKYNFNAMEEDELSFRKGDVLKILGAREDWYKAEMHGHEGYIPKNYVEVDHPSWYQENVGRSLAEERLKPCDIGSFIIRSSQSSPGDFSISVRHEYDVQHFKVMKDNKCQYYLWEERFSSLNKLVDFYRKTSISKQRQIYLRDVARRSSSPAVFSQMKRDSFPQVMNNHSSGMEASSRLSLQARSDNTTPLQCGKKGCLEQKANTMGSVGMSSSSYPVPGPRRASDMRPLPEPTMRVRALYDFTPEATDELGICAGDIVEVLDRSNASWWKGRLQHRVGLFPANYTVPI